MGRQILSALTIAMTVAYPLVIWLGQDRVQPRVLAVVLLLLSTTRLRTFHVSAAWRWCAGGTLLLVACALWANAVLPLKLYPVLVNGALLGLFAYSLVVPPSMVERWARLRESDLSARTISYTRRVTQVWCVFFAVNGAAALITALWASPAVWTLYNGFIAYLLMGLLFAGEYCVRWRFMRLQRG
jgi:uncharacterized membrane protein